MRPSVTLNMIVKNEAHHLDRLYESIKDAVDEWVVVDTGSTDGTLEKLKQYGATVHLFDWVHDFSAARNYALSKVKTDYFIWMDGDDSLQGKDQFIEFRDNIMESCDLWLATYDYAQNAEGKPVCSFVRERVAKTKRAEWKYFLHEGLNLKGGGSVQNASTWRIQHHRTLDDIESDRGRNLRVFEHNKDKVDARMTYYWGKELFEAGRKKEALSKLLQANSDPSLEHHDRVMALQYAAYILIGDEKYTECIDICHSGMLLEPQRAEFYVLKGDCYLKMGQIHNSIPAHQAAKHCHMQRNNHFAGLIFHHEQAYTTHPRNQLARAYVHLGEYEKAKVEAKESAEMGDAEGQAVLKEIEMVETRAIAYKDATPCDEIVFSVLGALYEFDELVAVERGVGGSEIALIEMAKNLHELTGKRVKVFQPRKGLLIAPSGVQYVSYETMADYFAKHKPALHVAWRHNQKLTDAKTVAWAHDLFMPGGEKVEHYDKILALSDFHKNLMRSMFNVPDEKIFVTRNGIKPERFEGLNTTKDPNKVIWMSSPDRGLERAIQILDLVRINKPNIHFHVFYGTDNMRKIGKIKEAEAFEKLMSDRPWVTNHGNLPQGELTKHYQDAAVWLYPTNFMETFCISAIEAVLCGVYPVVRKYGALPDTLRGIPSTIVGQDCVTVEDVKVWAEAVEEAIEQQRWNELHLSPERYSWKSVAEEWKQAFLGE